MSDDRILPVEQLAFARVFPAPPLVHRILVVDDDIAMRQLIVRLLHTVGHRVDAAEDGLIAWGELQQRTYDLLLTDHEMPRVTGVELVKKVRAARMALPVILVSGRLPTEELERHPGLRLSATLAKPFTGEELMTTVDDALRRPVDLEPPPRPAGAHGPGDWAADGPGARR